MRIIFRLTTLGLAGYGAWALYSRGGAQAPLTQSPIGEFSDRATRAVRTAAAETRSAVDDAKTEVQRAAKHLADETSRRVAAEHASTT